jgi:hypothetical protein
MQHRLGYIGSKQSSQILLILRQRAQTPKNILNAIAFCYFRKSQRLIIRFGFTQRFKQFVPAIFTRAMNANHV